MQLLLRGELEREWRFRGEWGLEHERHQLGDDPVFGRYAGWGGPIGAAPGRSKLALQQIGSYFYFDLWMSRDSVCELISGGSRSRRYRSSHHDDSSMESGYTSADSDAVDSLEGDPCGTLEHLAALAAPFPFHASTKAALGPRLLDTLRGLRGAEVEIPQDVRDAMWTDLAPWSTESGYEAYVERMYAEEDEADESDELESGEELEVRSTTARRR